MSAEAYNIIYDDDRNVLGCQVTDPKETDMKAIYRGEVGRFVPCADCKIENCPVSGNR
jgi:hypothetical protein